MEGRRSALSFIGSLMALIATAGCVVGRPPAASPWPVRPVFAGTPATYEASGRAIQVDGWVSGLTRIEFAGPDLQFLYRDPPGSENTESILAGGRIVLEGPDMRMQGSFLIRPTGPIILKAPHAVRFELGRIVNVTAERFYDEPGPIDPKSPVTITEPFIRPLDELHNDANWLNPPTTVRIRTENEGRERSKLSWAGSGKVAVNGKTYAGSHVEVTAKDITATVTRDPAQVRGKGTATLHQVYVDGNAQLRTTGVFDGRPEITRKSTLDGSEMAVFFPLRNTGNFDMAITRIRAVSPAARWLSLGLAPMPSLFAGEERPAKGGVTSGFLPGRPILSVLPPNDPAQDPNVRGFTTEYQRALSWVVPDGTPEATYEAELVVEGNFPSIPVTFHLTVAKRPKQPAPSSPTP